MSIFSEVCLAYMLLLSVDTCFAGKKSILIPDCCLQVPPPVLSSPQSALNPDVTACASVTSPTQVELVTTKEVLDYVTQSVGNDELVGDAEALPNPGRFLYT